MPRFIVKTTCHGFRNRRWLEGQIVDVKDSELDKLPRHFVPVAGPIPVKKEVPYEPIAISQLNQGQQAKGGLAQGLEEQTPTLDPKTLKPKRGRPKNG